MNFSFDDAHEFLRQLDPAATSFTFQTFDDTEQKRGYLARMFHGPLDRYAAELQDLNNQGAGVNRPGF